MMFSLSPSVEVQESSLNATFTEVASTGGAFCGAFNWGPVEEVITVSGENRLCDIFSTPDSSNDIQWWSAANFLAYSNNLKVVRVVGSNALNATDDADIIVESVTIVIPEISGGVEGVTKFVSEHVFSKLPNKIVVSVNGTELTDDEYKASLDEEKHLVVEPVKASENGDVISVSTNKFVIKNSDHFSSLSNLNGKVYAKYPGAIANGLKIYVATASNWDNISEKKVFSYKPAEGQISVAIIDNGKFDSVGSVLWIKENMSLTSTTINADGVTNFYKSYVNNNCPYIWVAGDLSESSEITLSNGVTDNNVTDANRIAGYNLFKATETIDFRALISGPASSTLANHLISNIAEYRKDCIAFISPDLNSMNSTDLEKSIIEFRNTLPSSSYYFLDGNWKYQYDSYNDNYIWVPCNADIAGLLSRTSQNNEPWFSPAGYNRGILKNVIKLKWNPDKTSRDELYSNDINPVIVESGFGALLLGDKTGLHKSSAFSRINVRMLFIIIEKAIATFAKYSLFEFNDEYTRAGFRNRTSNYLSNVAGRRGIEDDFQIKCDEENNDATVLNANGFVAAIKVRPLRSINFIQLKFQSYDYGVEFDEVAA